MNMNSCIRCAAIRTDFFFNRSKLRERNDTGTESIDATFVSEGRCIRTVGCGSHLWGVSGERDAMG